MAITSIDIDQNELKRAKQLAGTSSNRETVDLALRTLIAVRQQPSAVERIISRRFAADQTDAPTITPFDAEEIARDIQQALWSRGRIRAAAAFDCLIAAYAVANDAVVLNSYRDFG